MKFIDRKHICFTKSGDHAIRYALKLFKGVKVLLQDQGGWITYKQYAKKFSMQIVELKTEYGLIHADTLQGHKDCVLLLNSMPGYHALQDMKPIMDICSKNNIRVINDVSGSIGTPQAEYGDIILGSFGKDKPIHLGSGGFLATDFEQYAKEWTPEKQIVGLKKELQDLSKKKKMYKELRNIIIKELHTFTILHPASEGINVIVLFNSEQEKQTLINYCSQNSYEFTLCPRYIRVIEPAVSIELKRIHKR